MTTLLEQAKEKGMFQENAEQDPFTINAKSSVKLIKNTKGVNWEIKVVSGEEHLIESLCKKTLEQHNYIHNQLNKLGETNGK